MNLSGRHEIARPPEEVFRKLLDPEVVKSCIPGCESLVRSPDGSYHARIHARYGILGGTFKGRVVIRDAVPPRGYTMDLEGGGLLGSIRGTTRVSIESREGGAASEVSFASEIALGGLLGKIGERIVPGSAGEFSANFFQDLERAMGEVP
jgi:carbon monoxide dehydrogenase subunit G